MGPTNEQYYSHTNPPCYHPSFYTRPYPSLPLVWEILNYAFSVKDEECGARMLPVSHEAFLHVT